MCLVSVFVRYITFADFANPSIFAAIPILLMWLPVLAYAFPIILMYAILSGEMFASRNIVIRIIAFIGIYFVGLIGGGLLEWVCHKILIFIANIF